MTNITTTQSRIIINQAWIAEIYNIGEKIKYKMILKNQNNPDATRYAERVWELGMKSNLSLPGGISHRWCLPSHYTIVVYICGGRTAKKSVKAVKQWTRVRHAFKKNLRHDSGHRNSRHNMIFVIFFLK